MPNSYINLSFFFLTGAVSVLQPWQELKRWLFIQVIFKLNIMTGLGRVINYVCSAVLFFFNLLSQADRPFPEIFYLVRMKLDVI